MPDSATLPLGPDSCFAIGVPVEGGGGSLFLPHAAMKRTAISIRIVRISYSYGFLRCQLRRTVVPNTVSFSSYSDASPLQSRSPVARIMALWPLGSGTY